MSVAPKVALRVLQQEVRERAAAMEASHGPWPCRSGCDACCRRLGAVPSLTGVELEVLVETLEGLPGSTRTEIRARMEALAPDEHGHFTCPLLERSQGRCLVYEGRPIACRTYGFYAGREGDYWCERVTAHVGERRDTLVTGNQIAIDRERDARLGPSLDLVTLLRERLGWDAADVPGAGSKPWHDEP